MVIEGSQCVINEVFAPSFGAIRIWLQPRNHLLNRKTHARQYCLQEYQYVLPKKSSSVLALLDLYNQQTFLPSYPSWVQILY